MLKKQNSESHFQAIIGAEKVKARTRAHTHTHQTGQSSGSDAEVGPEGARGFAQTFFTFHLIQQKIYDNNNNKYITSSLLGGLRGVKPLYQSAPFTLTQRRHLQTGKGSACSAQKLLCQVSGVKIFIGNPAFKHHCTFLLIQS